MGRLKNAYFDLSKNLAPLIIVQSHACIPCPSSVPGPCMHAVSPPLCGDRLTAEGRGAATVYRDRATGKTVTKEEFVDSRKDPKKKLKEEKVRNRICMYWVFIQSQ